MAEERSPPRNGSPAASARTLDHYHDLQAVPPDPGLEHLPQGPPDLDAHQRAMESMGPILPPDPHEKQTDPDVTSVKSVSDPGSHRAASPIGGIPPSFGGRAWRACTSSPKRRWLSFIVVTFLAIAVTVGAAVGCTVGASRSGPRHATSPIHPSTSVMNGSGVVTLDLHDGTNRYVMYSQFHDGSIRKSEYANGSWSGGNEADTVEVVASDAKHGTPLMGLSYVVNSELIWKVMYIDNNNFLQESVNSNWTKGGWSNGLLGNGGFKASDSNSVGLSACYNYKWFGAPYNASDGGIRLYYGAENHTVQELRWANGQGAWEYGDNLGGNGDGGTECTVRNNDPPSITDLWLLNSEGQLELRWKDFNGSSNATSTWTKGLTYNEVKPNSAITAIVAASNSQKLVHIQLPNNTVRELVAVGSGAATRWQTFLDITGGAIRPAIAHSRLGSVVLNTTLGGAEIQVFYQTRGTDITQFVRTLDGTSWAVTEVPFGP